jgi:3-phosphoshikimate 1-carboxyvinyltransferase
MKIAPAKQLRGHLRLPGDKSISHRAALIAAIASGTSQIDNFSSSADCSATLACLERLGVSCQRRYNAVAITGAGSRGLRAAARELDCGNSGSTIRMLSGILAGQPFRSVLTGDESLRLRPMSRIIRPLELMGAQLHAVDGKPPLRIEGSYPLRPISYELPVASAQVKSCVLLAGLYADGRTEVIEQPGGTRDHTERMLRWFGVPVQSNSPADATGPVIAVEGPARFGARDLTVPSDVSSAAFLLAAAALLPGSELVVDGVGLNPTRSAFLPVLQRLGLEVEILEQREVCNEPVGTVRARGRDRDSQPATAGVTSIRGNVIASLIDELPLLAVVGSQIAGGIEIREAGELRVKETDRIAATARNLRAMGVEVAEFPDGLVVPGPTRLQGALIESYGDHRIAMAFAVAGLLAAGESEIVGSECAAVSFPEFFTVLESVSER